MDYPILSLVTFLPLIGAILLATLRGDESSVAQRSRILALLVSTVTFIASLPIMIHFDPANADFQFVEKAPWFAGYNIDYHLGIDGISLWLVLLTTFLMPICVLCSWNSITKRVAEFMARVRAALRHRVQMQGSPPIYDDGHLSVDLARRVVKVGDSDSRSTEITAGVAEGDRVLLTRP